MSLVNCEVCGKEIAKKAPTCPHCGAKRKKHVSLLGGTVFVIFFIIFVNFLGEVNDPKVQAEMSKTSDGIPTCESETAIGMAKAEVNTKILQASFNSPQLAALNMEVIDIEQAQELSDEPERKFRKCSGIARTNIGKTRIDYTFEILNDGSLHTQTSMPEL